MCTVFIIKSRKQMSETNKRKKQANRHSTQPYLAKPQVRDTGRHRLVHKGWVKVAQIQRIAHHWDPRWWDLIVTQTCLTTVSPSSPTPLPNHKTYFTANKRIPINVGKERVGLHSQRVVSLAAQSLGGIFHQKALDAMQWNAI